MTKKSTKPKAEDSSAATASPTKHQQVIALLTRECGASLEEMSAKVGWLPHSTRAFMAGLRKKGYVLDSEKVEGVRRYRIMSSPAA
ncbi:MAG: DUF3489 domain-containing protein [Sphingorhabdus sp.]